EIALRQLDISRQTRQLAAIVDCHHRTSLGWIPTIGDQMPECSGYSICSRIERRWPALTARSLARGLSAPTLRAPRALTANRIFAWPLLPSLHNRGQLSR